MAKDAAASHDAFIDKPLSNTWIRRTSRSTQELCYARFDSSWLKALPNPGFAAVHKAYFQYTSNSVLLASSEKQKLIITCSEENEPIKHLKRAFRRLLGSAEWHELPLRRSGKPELVIAVTPSQDIYILDAYVYTGHRVASMTPVIETLALGTHRRRFVLGLWKNVCVAVRTSFPKKRTSVVAGAVHLELSEDVETMKKTRQSMTSRLKKFKHFNCCASPDADAPKFDQLHSESIQLLPVQSCKKETPSYSSVPQKKEQKTVISCTRCAKHKSVYNIVMNAGRLAAYKSPGLILTFRPVDSSFKRYRRWMRNVAVSFKLKEPKTEILDNDAIFFFWLRQCPKLRIPTSDDLSSIENIPHYIRQVTFELDAVTLVLYAPSVVMIPDCLHHIQQNIVPLTPPAPACAEEIYVLHTEPQTPYPEALKGETMTPVYYPRVTLSDAPPYTFEFTYHDQQCKN